MRSLRTVGVAKDTAIYRERERERDAETQRNGETEKQRDRDRHIDRGIRLAARIWVYSNWQVLYWEVGGLLPLLHKPVSFFFVLAVFI